MSGRTTGARLRWRCIPPALATVLALVVVPLPASADECPPGTVPISEIALRQCDADQARLPELRLQFRVSEQRLTVATGDAEVLSRALHAQSELVMALRREVIAARPWLPGWSWWALGVASGMAATLMLVLAL